MPLPFFNECFSPPDKNVIDEGLEHEYLQEYSLAHACALQDLKTSTAWQLFMLDHHDYHDWTLVCEITQIFHYGHYLGWKLDKLIHRTSNISATEDGEPVASSEPDKEPNVSSLKTAATGTLTMLKDSAVHGAKVGAADAASDLLVAQVEKVLGNKYPPLAKTQQGKAVVAVLLAAAMHFAATTPMGAKVPFSEGAAAACGLVVEAKAQNVVNTILVLFAPVFKELADTVADVKIGGTA